MGTWDVWEVFGKDGTPVYRTKSRLVARILSRILKMDYARIGSGW